MAKIVVIGSSNTDMVVGTPKMPAPGETVIGNEFDIIQANMTANTQHQWDLSGKYSVYGPPGILFFDEKFKVI